jgi:hypothetical protein
MDPLVLEVMGSVSSVKPLLFGFVAVGTVLLVAVADQETDALLAFLKSKAKTSFTKSK